CFFFSSRRRHTRSKRDWSSDVCSSDLHLGAAELDEIITASRRLATATVLYGDIARSRWAYGLFAVAITPLAPGTFLRTDGLRSIDRKSVVKGKRVDGGRNQRPGKSSCK